MTDTIPTAEIERAKAWRIKRDLTMQELANLTGYSVSAVSWFERGLSPPRHGRWDGNDVRKPKPVPVRAWRRFKLLCELVELRLQYPNRKEFQW